MIKHFHKRLAKGRAARLGFTVPEYVVTVALVMLVSGGMLAGYLFGARLCVLAQARLDVNDDIRAVMQNLISDVRTSTDFDIGQGTASSFTPSGSNSLRQGNSIQIYPTAGTNNYIRYFLDTNAQSLKAVASGVTNVINLADAITNKMPFTSEDTFGNVVSNEQPWEIVGVKLQFSPTVIKNSTDSSQNVKQYFQINTRVTRRSVLGYQP